MTPSSVHSDPTLHATGRSTGIDLPDHPLADAMASALDGRELLGHPFYRTVAGRRAGAERVGRVRR